MKTVAGGLVWIAVLVLGTLAARRLPPETRDALEVTQTELWRGVVDPAPLFEVVFPRGTPVERGDGVFIAEGGSLRRVGEVDRVVVDADALRAWILVDSGHPTPLIREDTRILHRTQGETFAWVVKTLLPAPQRERVRLHWAAFRKQYEFELVWTLKPIAVEFARDFADVVMEVANRELTERTPELNTIFDRLRRDIGDRRLLPLIKDVVFPLLRESTQDPMQRIGRELWETFPLWAIAWRHGWEILPFTGDASVEGRWNRYVDEEAVPVLRSHLPEIQEILTSVAQELLADERVRAEMKEAVVEMLRDDELLGVLTDVMRSVALSPSLEEFLRSRLRDAEVQRRLARANERLQVFFDDLGNVLFLDESGEGINPDLALVLRTLLLRRDVHYLFLEPGTGAAAEPGEVLVGRRDD